MVAENKKINWRFNYFWKNKTKRQINSKEMKKQKTKQNKKNRLENKPDQFEIKGEGKRKLMVSLEQSQLRPPKWSHLRVVNHL